MDAETIRASVRRTGRLVVVDEAPATCSAASEIIALVTEDPDTFQASRPRCSACARLRCPFRQPAAGARGAARSDQDQGAVRRVLESAPVAV